MTTPQRSSPWLFYGGAVSLDFVNTLRDRATTARETLTSPAALTEWITEAELITAGSDGSGIVGTTSEGDYAEALELRESIDTVLSPDKTPQPSHARLINQWSLMAPRTQLQETDPGTTVTRVSTLVEALGATATNAIELIAHGQQEQVKVCAHQRCGLRFLDQSRAQQRQWCSMQRCGNRTKVARHTARQND